MKIRAEGSGGLSGQAECYEVDTAALPNGAAIERLLEDLRLLPAPPENVGADIARWHVTLEHAGQCRRFAFAEDGSSDAAPWQSLIAQLRASA